MISSREGPPPGTLSLRSRRSGDPVPLGEDPLVVDGRRSWIVEASPDRIAEIAEQGIGYAERLGARVVLLDFGNAVGRVDIPHLGTIRVVSGKWGPDDFETMLDEVVDRSAELPFRAAEPGALPYARSVSPRRRILYHCFVYLRHVLSDETRPERRLDRAYRTVLHEPHREWRRTRRTVPVGRAQGVDSQSLESLMTASNEFVDIRSTRARSTALSQALGGRLPVRIDEREDRSSVDTAENRFLKTFLGQIERIIEDMQRLAEESRRKQLQRRVPRECDAMRRKLRPILRHAMWADVGKMSSIPSASTVLQRRRGYRELFRHFSRLRLSTRLPLSEEESRDLLEIKDIALLYELWTFFRLSSVLEGMLGSPTGAVTLQRTELEAGLEWGTEIRWPSGVSLVYNPRFSRSKPRSRRSYSVPLRPDICLRVPSGPNAGLHLFDAKFRLRKIRDAIPDDDAEDETEDFESAERRGDFKRGDLYKMHTYRDAIPRVASVWILYPGSVGRFYSTDGAKWESGAGSLPDRVEGVGALSLVPGETEEPAGARRVLEGLLCSS